jgi:hypothetical protein
MSSLTPSFEGKYKVSFNSYYSNTPIALVLFLKAKIDLQATYDLHSLAVTQVTHNVVLKRRGFVFRYSIAGATSTEGVLSF